MFSTSVLCAIFSSVCKTSESSEIQEHSIIFLLDVLIIKNAYLYILIICFLSVKF